MILSARHLWRCVRRLFSQSETDAEQDLAREIQSHLDLESEEGRERGFSLEKANLAALRRFGNTSLVKEEVRAAWGWAWLEQALQDVRFGLRQVRRNRSFSAVAILSLALGIGANTAIFSLIDAVLLRSLPLAHPEQLTQVVMGKDSPSFTNPYWEQLRDGIRSGGDKEPFSTVFAWSFTRFDIAAGGEVNNIYGAWVSGDYFPGLGVNAAAGRLITPEDDKRGCAPIAVLSHSYWTRAYSADLSAVGKTISLEGHSAQIVGVTNPGFSGLDVGSSPDVFVPICSDPFLRAPGPSTLDQRSNRWLRVAGRMRPGVSATQAAVHLSVLAPEIFRATLPPNWSTEQQKRYLERKLGALTIPNGVSAVRREYEDPLWVLMWAVTLVLLIACANVANLLLARSTARQREMAVRLALGAGRGRLIRQNLTESMILSLSGAVLGLVFARWASQILTTLISTRDSEVRLDLTPDLRVLLFTAGVGLLTGVLFGLMPALRASDVSPNTAGKAQGRGIDEGWSRMKLGKALVVAQVALSMVLVTGAGLMLATFRNLATLDPGFRSEGLLLVNADLRRGNLPKGTELTVLRSILDRVRGLPGVRSAAVVNVAPLSNYSNWDDTIKVDNAGVRPGDESVVMFNSTTPGYFATMETAFVAGRDFNDHDIEGAPKVAIVNQAISQRYFGKANPLGHTFRIQKGDHWSDAIEIVGVVRDAKYDKMRETSPATAYVPLAQQFTLSPNYVIRAAGSPIAIITGVKQEIAAVNPNIALRFTPMTQQLADHLARERMLATLATFFGALALALAALGLYGVLSYNVARRRSEIGIRMALGARQSSVMSMIMSEASWLAFVGLGLGLAGTLGATRLVTAFLYGLQGDDPPTLAGSAAVLAAVAALAAYLPARRASRLDPMIALRDE